MFTTSLALIEVEPCGVTIPTTTLRPRVFYDISDKSSKKVYGVSYLLTERRLIAESD